MPGQGRPALPGTLAGIVGAVRRQAAVTVQVDITPYIDGAENPVVLEWRNPSVTEVYRIARDAAELLKRKPLWSEQLAVDVATLGTCHVAPNPGGLAPSLFYAQIADTNDQLWYHLMREMGRHFPHLKESSLPMVEELLDLCVQYLHRHPDELSHLPAEVVGELRAMAARKAAQTTVEA